MRQFGRIVMYRQQEQQPSGWSSYSYEYPNPLTVGDLLSVKQTSKPVWGAGPATMTATRELASEISGTSAKKNAWPFMVCLFHYIIWIGFIVIGLREWPYLLITYELL
jgi:hypothetical protein